MAETTIAVVGCGVVGTATGMGFQAQGYEVVFCDASAARLLFLRHQGLCAIDPADLSLVRAGLYFIAVPTPTVDGAVDLTHVREASEAIGRSLKDHPGHPTVVVRSTVPPGTTTGVVVPIIERVAGRSAGSDFGVCMNPEFLRAASAAEDFANPKVIVIGGLDTSSIAALVEPYSHWSNVPIKTMDIVTAEVTKYVSNLFNATKISFFNEMHRLLMSIGADPVSSFAAVSIGAEGMWNPRYGTRGGAPYGGMCLPKDTEGFLDFARAQGLGHLLPLLAATIRVNDEMTRAAELAELIYPPVDEGLMDTDLAL